MAAYKFKHPPSKPIDLHEDLIKTSMLSDSSNIEDQDGNMTCEDFPRIKEIISAGPNDKKAMNVIGTIIKQGYTSLKKLVFQHLVELLKNELVAKGNQAKFRIWPGTMHLTEEIKFVCLYKGKLETPLQNYFGIDIQYKDIDIPAPLIDFENNDLLNWKMSTDQDVLLIKAAIEKHGDRLFEQHSNLQVVCGGPFKLLESNRRVEKSNTIILYCHAKGIIPCGEDAFPSSLAINDIYIPVDVREGHFALAVGRQEWHEPLCMGISIGASRDHRAGTLGPFVNLGDEGFGFLTCAHVVGAEGTNVVQPSDGDNKVPQTHEDTICGTVVKCIFNTDIPNTRSGTGNTVGVDAALVKLNTKRKPDPTIFPFIPVSDLNEIGFPSETTFLYTDGPIACPEELSIPCGKEVVKYGRTTGLRKGTLVMDGAIVKIDNYELFYEKYQNKFIMKSQYLIERSGPGQFAEPGDSGSGVFALGEENKLTLIGLVVGVLAASLDYRCVVTPINDILRALEISPDALKFPENMEVDF